MQYMLNGKNQTSDTPLVILDLLQELKLDPVRVAVELNEDVLPRKTFGETSIRNGDRIEIVTFVGGG
ncbi:MAG: sulfur carrier protein ThiS [Planctomycetota bacterium]